MMERGESSIGSQGITTSHPGDLKLSIQQTLSCGYHNDTAIDSCPSRGWWTPPLHGEDVVCLQKTLEVRENHRLNRCEHFLEFLLSQDECIEIQDVLPCFENEEGLLPFHARQSNRKSIGVEPPGPDHADYVSLVKINLATYFYHDWSMCGHLVCRPRFDSESDLERHLNAIPGHLPDLVDLKQKFKECNEAACKAVRTTDWRTACQHYEECLNILEGMENHLWIRIHTWLVLWVCIPLVHMYQIWLKDYPKCITLYNQMLQQLNREDGSGNEAWLGSLYYEIVWHRRMVLFEWSHTLDKKREGDPLGLYIRAKAFSAIAVPNEQDFVTLQEMVNHWGKKSAMQSCEGDMRVAFCFNLQHLLSHCGGEQSQLIEWTRQKWTWINRADVSQDSYIKLKLQDIGSYKSADMVEEAQSVLAQVESETAQLGSSYIKFNVLTHKARLCIRSNPAEADRLITLARRGLEKLNLSCIDPALLFARMTAMDVLSERFCGFRIWEDSQFGVKPPTSNKDSDRARDAMKRFKEVFPKSKDSFYGQERNPLLCRYIGDHLMIKVWAKAGESIGKRWDMLRKAMNVYERSLQLLRQTSERTLKRTRWDEIKCHKSLCDCHRIANQLKDPYLMYCANLGKDLDVHTECDHLQTATDHLLKALELATTPRHDDVLESIRKELGIVHFFKAMALVDRAQTLVKLIPQFQSHPDFKGIQIHESEIRLEIREPDDRNSPQTSKFKIVRVHSLVVRVENAADTNEELSGGSFQIIGGNWFKIKVTYAVEAEGMKDAAKLDCTWMKTVSIKRPSIFLACLMDDFFVMLLKDLMEEVQKSADYLKESIKVEFGNFLFNTESEDHGRDGIIIITPADWLKVEASKKQFTMLQHLIGIEDFVKVNRQALALKRFYQLVLDSDVETCRQELQQIRSPERCDKTILVNYMLYKQGFTRELADWGYQPDPRELSQLITLTSQFFELSEERLVEIEPTRRERIYDSLARYNIQQNPPNFTLPQKCLLWAERGRSRILTYQLHLANKVLLEDETENIAHNVNSFTDQDLWQRLRAAQLACGNTTVLVEYTFNFFDRGTHGEIQVVILVVNKEGDVHARQAKLTEFKKPGHLLPLVDNIHAYMSGKEDSDLKSDKDVQTSLEKLYDIFIRPIADLLDRMQAKDKLVFALDEHLTNVPFSVLLDKETGKHLFENHTISFIPALRILLDCEKRFTSICQASEIRPSVALGDPAYECEDRLESTLEEVMKISEGFPADSVKVFTGTDATVDNLVKWANLPVNTAQGFVHVAAHGFVDKKNKSGSLKLADSDEPNSLPSGISTDRTGTPSRFSSRHLPDDGDELEGATYADHKFDMLGVGCVRGGSTKDQNKDLEEDAMEGILRSENVVRLGFGRSRMVVLSACNTAKGFPMSSEVAGNDWNRRKDRVDEIYLSLTLFPVLRSEGVVGLPRAFLVAGVPCVVSSQWELDDESSSQLMQKFYKEMSGGSDVASALRGAMLLMKLSEGSPAAIARSVREWGGYLVWGCPQ